MKFNIRKLVSLGLAISMALSMVACGKSDSNKQETFVEDEVVEGDRVQADWFDTAVIYEVNIRQYTEEGTFKAFSEHLERLQSLGVNTLWFMPIYPISELNKKGTLGSYYSIKDYTDINSEFGTMDDFKELVNTAHDMGFHVIIDWVANHTGWDHTWITEHPEYYVKDENGDIIYPLDTDWYDVAQLDYSNPDMRNAMIECMKFWVEEVDVDGFRCDYAQGVPIDFWESARAELDKIKPIYMVAEDGTSSNSLLNSAFDSNYNFDLYDGLKLASSVSNSADKLEYYISSDLPYGAAKMNFIDNHDKNTYDGTLDERFGNESLGALYTVIFTAEGLPLIYSGNEEDTDISLEFFEKDNINFRDYKYTELISALCNIKTTYEPLYNGVAGGKVRIIEDDNKSVLAYERVKNGKKITVVVNLSDIEQTVKYDKKLSSGKILLHGNSEGIIDASGENDVKVKSLNNLSSYEYYIILS
jgi:glycosidase